jgi:undecaprenyl-diphosphatase
MPKSPASDATTAISRLRRPEGAILGGLLLVAGLVLGFVGLAELVTRGSTVAFDNAVLNAFRTAGDQTDPIGPAWVEEMARDVTALGSFAGLGLLFISVVLYLVFTGKRSAALLMSVSVLGGVAISTLLKMSYDRPRPELTQTARVFTASFPSGHAMLSAVTFLTLGALLTRVRGNHQLRVYFMTMAVLLTVLVGVSRIYLGVHYPTDVLAGWCVGSAWAGLCFLVMVWLQQRGGVEQPDDPA